MIENKTCPFCGKNIKFGWNPETNKQYDYYKIQLNSCKEYYFDISSAIICKDCYYKLYDDIKFLERRIRNEQPKFP